jgi:hypothetical protein
MNKEAIDALDECHQCRHNPFGLCPQGAKLILATQKEPEKRK